MCVMSAVSEYAGRWVPQQQPYPLAQPNQAPWPPNLAGLGQQVQSRMDAEALELLKKILALCEKLDAKMGEPDCVDPEKAKILVALEEYVKSQQASD